MLSDCISETEIQIDDYTLFRRDRFGKRGGGVCIYVKSNVSVTVLEEYKTSHVKILWLKITLF